MRIFTNISKFFKKYVYIYILYVFKHLKLVLDFYLCVLLPDKLLYTRICIYDHHNSNNVVVDKPISYLL